MKSPLIQISNLVKSYELGTETIPVLQDIAFDVFHGDYAAIMGPSGSGKSTLMHILGCLDVATSGDYILNGTNVSHLDITALARIRNRQIGFVFQNFNLLPNYSLMDNVGVPLIYSDVPRELRSERVESAMKRVGIWERRLHKPSEVSGGQKQRAAIARALVLQPSLILADEPTGNLDSHTAEEIMSMFKELNNEGNTIIMVTHDTKVASHVKRILQIMDGQLTIR